MPWIDEFHAVPIMEARGLVRGAFERTIGPLVMRLGLDAARIGVDECALVQIQEFERVLAGVTLGDGDALMQQARRIKFREEIALIEEACAIGGRRSSRPPFGRSGPGFGRTTSRQRQCMLSTGWAARWRT